MTLTELAIPAGMALVSLFILNIGRAHAIRFSTFEAICAALSCPPGVILGRIGRHVHGRPRAGRTDPEKSPVAGQVQA